MKLYAISDLHLRSEDNRLALQALSPHPEDWLILAGDVGETEAHLHFALQVLSPRFQQLLWAPGNHDLWTMPSEPNALRGEAKYQRLVAICRDYGVLTPEDPYVRWPGEGQPYLLAPLFILYDYSFRPDDVPFGKAVEWAAESGVVCADEVLLHPDPYSSLADWCADRCRYSEGRLLALPPGVQLVLINHFPLRQDLVRLRRIPRFKLWCGSRCTEDWHVRFPVAVAVYGHLHIRGTYLRDGVRFEEVSFGYARDWDYWRGLKSYLRQILPEPDVAHEGEL